MWFLRQATNFVEQMACRHSGRGFGYGALSIDVVLLPARNAFNKCMKRGKLYSWWRRRLVPEMVIARRMVKNADFAGIPLMDLP